MKLPNLHLAVIPEEKLTQYLLNPSHPAGGSKASFFLNFGFTVANWSQLAERLLEHAQANDVVETSQTNYGTRYIIDGPLTAPKGTTVNVRCAWYIDANSEAPRFVTAHPLPKI